MRTVSPTWRLLVVGAAVALVAGCNAASTASPDAAKPTAPAPQTIELLNVSYDPTRELYQELNKLFADEYLKSANVAISVKQSHGGSSSQARAVIDGLDADVVTLALWSDIDAIRKQGLIRDGWEDRLPNCSLPYYSTIVFVVRKGNPKQIKDWPDLVQPGVKIITPNPITGGGAKLNFLAAWGSVVLRGGSEEDAQEFVRKLYAQVPVLDSGARGSATTFAQKKIGDVHLAWENEAFREVQDLADELEIVYPPISIRAEPNVAVVDSVAEKHGTANAATDYLKFLYSDAAQEVAARHYYRPSNEAIAEAHAAKFEDLQMFPITSIARDWDEAFQKFFASGGVYEAIYQRPSGGSTEAKSN